MIIIIIIIIIKCDDDDNNNDKIGFFRIIIIRIMKLYYKNVNIKDSCMKLKKYN